MELADMRHDSERPWEVALRLRKQGKFTEALAASQKAVRLADAGADKDELAISLYGLACALCDLRRYDECLDAAEKFVATRREGAESAPSVDSRFQLAVALSQLSFFQSEAERFGDAAAAEEAVDILRSLSAELDEPGVLRIFVGGEYGGHVHGRGGGNNERLRLMLAKALNNLAIRKNGMGKRVEALAHVDESLSILRAAASVPPNMRTGVYRDQIPDLAKTLYNRALWLTEEGRPQEAFKDCVEAVQFYRSLGDSYLFHQSCAVNNLGIILADMDKPEEAVSVSEEAVRRAKQLADRDPRYLSDLELARTNLRNRQDELAGKSTRRSKWRRLWKR
jgi:tetratricopeptide (TPR) repeat protein